MNNPSTDFNAIGIKLASPERIKEWSHGEVTKPETINYRTQRSERGGLFDERIFGPEKDFECYCGKYKGIRYKGIICEKCGVEITRAIVRRDRMGHIELAAPVSHIWFLRGIPSRIGLLLNLPVAELEKVIYFAAYVVTKVDEREKEELLKQLDQEYKSKVKSLEAKGAKDKMKELLTAAKKEIDGITVGLILDEMTYHKYSLKYSSAFEAGIGAEAVYAMFQKLDLKKLQTHMLTTLEKAGAVERVKLYKRLSLVKAMLRSGVRPEWMFLTAIPVIPPGMRPMVALEGGRHATSDVNDLYRRVINRNNRLKKLIEIDAPEVILRNEKRILQEAVDALIDNSIRHGSTSAAMSQTQRRQLKSLADTLKGKGGLFRQNLLGKRVDYSGRSVIVVGPDLKLNQCGLPKHMALELFRPFVIAKLLDQGLAFNIRGANRLIDEGIPEVWGNLEDVIKGKYVLLNRAPTLHRLGIQAFNPTLIEGNAIQVHPLVCSAFNADFDGDQMAVHVPLSDEAQAEAKNLMASNKNLLKPGSGDPVVNPGQDIVLGCYWMTKIVEGEAGEGKIFATPNASITAYDFGVVGFRSKIKVMGTDTDKYKQFEGKPFETTVGRLLFNSVLPSDFPFINKVVTKKDLANMVDDLITRYGIDGTPQALDKIKAFGYKYVTKSGVTWSLSDVKVPPEKKAIVAAARKEELGVMENYEEGLLSADEKYRKVIEIWTRVQNDIEKVVPNGLPLNGPVMDMITSGARGSIKQVSLMVGIKGLTQGPSGRIIDFPMVPSLKEGLTPLEYFISTHGARKGMTDTALNTAKAGYLTRRLVDVAQDVVVLEEDCGERDGIRLTKENALGIEITMSRNSRGRVLAKDAVANGKVIFKKGSLLGRDEAKLIETSGVEEVFVHSPLVCKTLRGVCQKCYGMDLGRGVMVALGETVGIVAAQAIGEPGTQLTMRTFHAGGAAGEDITMGLPRVEDIFERQTPKAQAVVCKIDGVVSDIKHGEKDDLIIVVLGEESSKKEKEAKEVEHSVSFRRSPLVKVGAHVKAGDLITDGYADIDELYKFGGLDRAQRYIIAEINKIYETQGASISRKHVEVIVRQMFSRRKIKSTGDTKFSIGNTVEESTLNVENARVKAQGGEEAKGEQLVLGITDVALTKESFLSAASFQNTSRVLIEAAVQGSVDKLYGLKENVILGRLIPAGTGFHTNRVEPEYDPEDDLPPREIVQA
ncbi:MAG: DNA-directed RNA polymerase subunit beta' [Candidatus Lloydbacteria bacterium RIFCSPHIGHO2_01_FULL_49_22]|uniref:DNA-directed RNA polymerase subunit beta' n=1 Tax=Candidatus Lloydbacteria bacterium RIFCSPHIGHO2_01_FULL_49_22 TaxID=1798658 RepID=A0A1G2CWZ9_9BACT|nr:MAG: DNA-directed RNA polymerase subunit beta' [Candidatus Lloydbacteria bacterium RIFCSPHIGHO2_01_FULL_49_22]OGZ09082.1 MAG: DNA-directed RNA polymerase subunit beta' [Candidatus Lloydbacteria bacterium RIFCSPHIGHO2_02_FULL_50_18]